MQSKKIKQLPTAEVLWPDLSHKSIFFANLGALNLDDDPALPCSGGLWLCVLGQPRECKVGQANNPVSWEAFAASSCWEAMPQGRAGV